MKSLCQNDSVRVLCQTGLALGPRCCKAAKCHWTIINDTHKIRAPGNRFPLSDWMHLKGLGPIYLLPHDDDDGEHADSSCTLLLCAPGEGKRKWPLSTS